MSDLQNMPERICQMCGGPIYELGDSPWCNYCGKIMCSDCEKKHNKEECKGKQEPRK